eukprot:15366654-Ditylum_brightwellii.AAC.1
MEILGHPLTMWVIVSLCFKHSQHNAMHSKSNGVIAPGSLVPPQPVPKRKAHGGACDEVLLSADCWFLQPQHSWDRPMHSWECISATLVMPWPLIE